jgi:hypothetical protein
VKLAAACALFLAAVGVLAPGRIAAAMEIVLTVSPSNASVDRPVEVLIRTFLPVVGPEASVDLHPRTPFPAATGYTVALFAFPDDYPFRVTATGPAGRALRVPVLRDPSDATLYRGAVRFPAAGRWRVAVENYPAGLAGTWIELQVDGAPGVASDASRSPWRDERLEISILAGVAGLTAGFLLGRRRSGSMPGHP